MHGLIWMHSWQLILLNSNIVAQMHCERNKIFILLRSLWGMVQTGRLVDWINLFLWTGEFALRFLYKSIFP